MKLIVAVNNLGYIGKNGGLMWRSSEDFKHFKAKTMGGILIMGRTTYEKDLKGKTLPGRQIVVVGTGYKSLWGAIENAMFLKDTSLNKVRDLPPAEIWVAGGSTIYKQLIYLCDEIHISVINDNQVGDVKFEVPADYRGKVFTYSFEPNPTEIK